MFNKITRLITFALVALLTVSLRVANASDIKTAIVPESLKSMYAEFKYAPAIRAGDMLYLSGVVAKVTEGDQGDVSKSIVRTFDEIEMVLLEAGATWANVIDVTSYMTDLDNHIGPLWAIKDSRLPAPYPAWTAIGVKNLFGGPSVIMEIKVVAYLPE